MKRLLIVILIASGIWAGYWAIGSQGVKSGFAQWFETRRAEGWAAEYSALSVKGFASRFDTTLTDVALADPRTGWAWEASFFQVLALSYKPHHVIAVWPNEQLLATPNQKFDILSSKMQASLVVDPALSLALDRVNLQADALRIAPRGGDATQMSSLQFALRRLPGDAHQYQVALSADEFTPPKALRSLIAESLDLPQTLSSLKADVTLAFDAPWDRFALEQERPQPTELTLNLIDASWGELQLAAAGQLKIDANGLANGTITIKARNWRDILKLAVTLGALPEGLAQQVENGLTMLAGASGNSKTLDLPLELREGRVFFGPFPIAHAPVFQLR